MKRALLYFGLITLLMACSNREEAVVEQYPDGTPKVKAVYVEKDGTRYKSEETGFYEDGKPEITGQFDQQGKRQGKWKYWYPGGQLWSECDYLDGLKHGSSIVYFEDGKKRYEGRYEQDQKTGPWKFWNSNGELATEVNY